MATFTLTIECDNAAFENDPLGEVARILREAAYQLDQGQDGFKLRDINGNTVGSAAFEDN
jgi:hypothetical protein